MKKLITSVAVCSLAVCSLASCGAKEKASTEIIGKWSMSGVDNLGVDSGGIIFSKDGKGSIYEDTSSLLHFTSDGIKFNDTVLSKDYIKKSGKTLTISALDQDILVITELEGGDGYDGKYSLDGGIMYESIVEGMKAQGEVKSTDLDITINFDGERSEVVFNDIFDYEVKGSKLTVSGFSGFIAGEGDEASAKVTIDGDTLSLKDSKKTETLTKVK